MGTHMARAAKGATNQTSQSVTEAFQNAVSSTLVPLRTAGLGGVQQPGLAAAGRPQHAAMSDARWLPQGEPAEGEGDKAEGVPVSTSFTANVWEVCTCHAQACDCRQDAWDQQAAAVPARQWRARQQRRSVPGIL